MKRIEVCPPSPIQKKMRMQIFQKWVKEMCLIVKLKLKKKKFDPVFGCRRNRCRFGPKMTKVENQNPSEERKSTLSEALLASDFQFWSSSDSPFHKKIGIGILMGSFSSPIAAIDCTRFQQQHVWKFLKLMKMREHRRKKFRLMSWRRGNCFRT